MKVEKRVEITVTGAPKPPTWMGYLIMLGALALPLAVVVRKVVELGRKAK